MYSQNTGHYFKQTSHSFLMYQLQPT
uniref:Uncharacterized protein n=1 Tax=Anguilla anguilla TaxID=7936 RepID=A0A0E9SEV7_ANGAN